VISLKELLVQQLPARSPRMRSKQRCRWSHLSMAGRPTQNRVVSPLRKGLSETGYIEDQNVRVEYHWLEGHYERLPALLTE